MSGGYFAYTQNSIREIAEEIEFEMEQNKTIPAGMDAREWAHDYKRRRYKPETMREFKKAVKILKKAYVYAQRIDWLFSGDDSEESFLERLKEELEKL